MKLIRSFHQTLSEPCVATIGNFDGVHAGHQILLNKVVEKAEAQNLSSLLLTFEPLPREYFARENSIVRLTSLREKIICLNDQVDYVVCLRFNQILASLSAEVFVDYLLTRLRVKILVVGEDFQFGRKRAGNVTLLKKLFSEQGAEVIVIAPVMDQTEKRISSTAVRETLANADLSTAAQLLQRRYFFAGRVCHGDALGREIGYPTANLLIKKRSLAVHGIFVTRVFLRDRYYFGATSIGTRPTVHGKQLTLETYLFDFAELIYGEHIKVELLHYLRPELYFDSMEKLIQQIEQDVAMAKAWIAEHFSDPRRVD